MKKGVVKNFGKFTEKYLVPESFFNKVAALRPATLLKRRLAQVFLCEFSKIFKNTFFTEHLWTTASEEFAFFGNVYSSCIRFYLLFFHITHTGFCVITPFK